MKTLKLQFSEALQNDLLNGGIIVCQNVSELYAVILVRLPKGSFHLDNDVEFEYVQYDQQVGEKMYHSVSRNGTKRAVSKRAKESYWEDWNYYRKKKQKATS